MTLFVLSYLKDHNEDYIFKSLSNVYKGTHLCQDASAEGNWESSPLLWLQKSLDLPAFLN